MEMGIGEDWNMLFTHSLTHIRIYIHYISPKLYTYFGQWISGYVYIYVYMIYIYDIYIHRVQTRIIHKRTFRDLSLSVCLRGENYICRDIYIYIYMYMYSVLYCTCTCMYICNSARRKKEEKKKKKGGFFSQSVISFYLFW